jgi:hypothetical protein
MTKQAADNGASPMPEGEEERMAALGDEFAQLVYSKTHSISNMQVAKEGFCNGWEAGIREGRRLGQKERVQEERGRAVRICGRKNAEITRMREALEEIAQFKLYPECAESMRDIAREALAPPAEPHGEAGKE